MKKFDTLVEEVKKSLITESPNYHKNLPLAKEHTVTHSENVAETKKYGKRLEDFEDHQVYLLEKDIAGQTKLYVFCFFKNKQCQCMLKVQHEKTIDRDASKWKPSPGLVDEFTLLTADQRHEESNLGLARKIVLNYFSKLFLSLISGEDANDFGRPFWEKLLKGALEKGFKVFGSLSRREHEFKPEDFEKYWLKDDFKELRNPADIRTKTSAGGKYFKIVFQNVA
jgi:hypothetical protein